MAKRRKEPSPDGFYSAQEAADILGMHRMSLLRALRNKTIKLKVYSFAARQCHAKYFFEVAQVERLADARRALRS